MEAGSSQSSWLTFILKPFVPKRMGSFKNLIDFVFTESVAINERVELTTQNKRSKNK